MKKRKKIGLTLNKKTISNFNAELLRGGSSDSSGPPPGGGGVSGACQSSMNNLQCPLACPG